MYLTISKNNSSIHILLLSIDEITLKLPGSPQTILTYTSRERYLRITLSTCSTPGGARSNKQALHSFVMLGNFKHLLESDLFQYVQACENVIQIMK